MLESEEEKISERVRLKMEKFSGELKKEFPQQPRINLKPYRGETTVFDSKFGGVPYMPKDMEYPKAREGYLEGKPLHLLAQFNFEKLSHIEGFPDKGILEFFAGCDDDDCVGMGGDPFDQNSFRIIYHEDIIYDESKLMSAEDMPEFDPDDYMFPFTGEFALQVSEPELCSISCNDYRFCDVAAKCYNRLFGTNLKYLFGEDGISGDDEEFSSYMYRSDDSAGSHIGGFPFFTQGDPRYDNKTNCDILLFQMDSEGDEIMWGDCGVANFFISAEDLAKRDFSHVFYSWDCC